MEGIKSVKARSRQVVYTLITLSIMLLLVFLGPVNAFSIGLNEFSDSEPKRGEKVSTSVSVKIQANERMNLGNASIFINDVLACIYNPYNGQKISECSGINIELISNNSNYGYGYGYAYGENYGYGYHEGYYDGNFIYNLTIDTSFFDVGEKNVKVKIDVGGGRVYSSESREFTIKPKIVANNMTIYSPKPVTYNDDMVAINISLSEDVKKLMYINYDNYRPKWIYLCSNCDEYGFSRKKTQAFDEGLNNITIRAEYKSGAIEEKNIGFFVDSKKPIISTVKPRSNSVTNGTDFYIKYTEANCKLLSLTILGSVGGDSKSEPCVSGKNVERLMSISLSSYDGQEIRYKFIILDAANNSVDSRLTRVEVDTTSPIINNPDSLFKKGIRSGIFNISITEKNFDEVGYYETVNGRQRYTRLCSSLRNGYCYKKVTLKSGQHDLLIRVLDDAGNSADKVLSFSV